MKSIAFAALTGLLARTVTSHATFQQLWVDGVDFGSQCVRTPPSNNPVENVASQDITCNVGGTRGVSGKCPVRAGGIVTVEMHQHADRSCANEAIGGQHYGPVSIYMAKVPDASTADGVSASWFKVHENGWAKNPSASRGDDDYWGVKDLNSCCGKMDVQIPSTLENGDYLIRAEVLALHVAQTSGLAQFYMSCYQVSVTGGSGTLNPSGVRFPGQHVASHPGIHVNIHGLMSGYTIPGPPVVSGGRSITAGQGCRSGCEVTCRPGSGSTGTVPPPPAPTGSPPTPPGGTPPGQGNPPSGCSVAQYGQCGGNGYTGCTTCASGFTCRDVSPPWYSQCQ